MTQSAMTTPPGEATCRAQDCETSIDTAELMCTLHWAMVPASLRDSLTATYDPAGEPSKEHLAYIAAAVAGVAHKEKRRKPAAHAAAKPPAKRGKPEQLALFDLVPAR